MYTVDEVLQNLTETEKQGGEGLDKFTTPFYSTQVQYNEGFLYREDIHGAPLPIKTVFPIAKVLEVRSNDFRYIYQEGKDYLVEGGKLVIPEGSAIVAMPKEEFYLEKGEPSDWLFNAQAGEDEDYGMTIDKMQLYKYRYVITYVRTEAYDGLRLSSKAQKLKTFSEKISNNEDVQVVYIGDSIGEGAGISGSFKNLVELTCEGIDAKTAGTVSLSNCSVGGIDSAEFAYLVKGEYSFINPNIIEKAKNRLSTMEKKLPMADIVFIALGANDSSADRDAELFSLNIQTLVEYCREKNPDVSIVLVSSPDINPKIKRNKSYDTRNLKIHDIGLYATALQALETEYDNLVFADVYGGQAIIRECKYIEDYIADNLNHPTDYMSRIVAQFLLQTIF